MAGLGWFGMLAPEAEGGSGFSAPDIVDLLDALGASLAPEPVAPSLAAVAALSHSDAPEARSLRDRVVSGEVVALVFAQPAPDSLDQGVKLAGGRLNGRTGSRGGVHLGETFLVGCDADGQAALIAVPRRRSDVTVEARRTVDGGAAGCLRFDGADAYSLPVLARGAAAQAAQRDALDIERLGHAAMLAGLAARALELTVDYLKTRVQFGVPIGSFEALQHRAASMHVDVAASRALVREAARAIGHPGQTMAAAAAKAYAADAALRVTREAIQMHGAIGFTDEHDIGLYHRRALALAAEDGGVAAARAMWMDRAE
jgi:alkylation response protein AidB-like acyl-CoA dehydrogenase